MPTYSGKVIMKKNIGILAAAILLPLSLIGCGNAASSSYRPNSSLDVSKSITLKLCGSSSSFQAIQAVINSFETIYENVTIEYEYVQNYSASMIKRLSASGTPTVDLFVNNGVKDGSKDSVYTDYCLDLSKAANQLNLQDCFSGLIANLTNSDSSLYSIPLGSEARGLFVNKTFLQEKGIATPSKWSEFESACLTLQKQGYIPVQGNPATFAITFFYPYICNLIANSSDKTVYDKVNARSAGISEYFREPVSRLYDLVSKNYYQYKKAETDFGNFTAGSESAACSSFLGIKSVTDPATSSVNVSLTGDDYLGRVAFMPGVLSTKQVMDQYIDDYHLSTEYEFIPSPLGTEGGYAYLSPSLCISANKAIDDTQKAWALEFLNYLFTKEENKTFAKIQGCFPNTADVMDYLKQNFDVPADRVCHVGQVTFSYDLYAIIKTFLTTLSKDNNTEKWVAPHPTDRMYTLEEFMAQLETALTGGTTLA
jgi:ABC-type glycerol-3-phosphate transport system substrate-binding protein